MGLISTEVEVILGVTNIKYYENLGYEIPRYKDRHGNYSVKRGTKITVKVEHLQPHSTSKVNVECDNCGKEYKVIYNNYTKFNHGGKCYCIDCSRIIFNSGENNHGWNAELTDEEREERRNIEGYDDFVRRVLARDNYICVNCGKKSFKDIIVHHLDGYSWCKEKRMDDDNGVTLCSVCHKNFHSLYGYKNNTKDQFCEWIGEFKQKSKYTDKIPTRRKVFLYEDKITFDNASECAKYLHLTDPTSIYSCCNRKKLLTVKKKHLFWLDEYEKMSKEEIDVIVGLQPKHYKKIICLNTGEIYNKITEVKIDYPDISTASISYCCKGKSKYCFKDKTHKERLNWMYYEDYIKTQSVLN